MAKLPLSAKKYFWDVNFDELDTSKYSRFVIERLLEYGDFPELKWLFAEFNETQIVEVVKTSDKLSRLSANGWANYFDIPHSEVQTLKIDPFSEIRKYRRKIILPSFAYKYFWDINPANLNVAKRPIYVIQRLLDFGDKQTIKWLFDHFKEQEITVVLKNSRNFSRYSARKWAKYFHIPKEEIIILNGRFQGFWPY